MIPSQLSHANLLRSVGIANAPGILPIMVYTGEAPPERGSEIRHLGIEKGLSSKCFEQTHLMAVSVYLLSSMKMKMTDMVTGRYVQLVPFSIKGI